MAKKRPAARPRMSLSEIASNPLAALPELLRAIAVIGVPSVIALFLVWWLTNVIPNRLDKLEALSDAQGRALTALLGHLQMESDQGWVMQSTLARICINTARTDADRLSCVSIARRPTP